MTDQQAKTLTLSRLHSRNEGMFSLYDIVCQQGTDLSAHLDRLMVDLMRAAMLDGEVMLKLNSPGGRITRLEVLP